MVKQHFCEAFCTVFQAELLATLETTEMVIKASDTNIAIISDLTSSLELLKYRDCTHPLAHQIRENLHHQSKTVEFYWLRAHMGTQGNERPDFLAKEAAL